MRKELKELVNVCGGRQYYDQVEILVNSIESYRKAILRYTIGEYYGNIDSINDETISSFLRSVPEYDHKQVKSTWATILNNNESIYEADEFKAIFNKVFLYDNADEETKRVYDKEYRAAKDLHRSRNIQYPEYWIKEVEENGEVDMIAEDMSDTAIVMMLADWFIKFEGKRPSLPFTSDSTEDDIHEFYYHYFKETYCNDELLSKATREKVDKYLYKLTDKIYRLF